MKRTAIYVSVSTEKQEAENQLSQMRRFAESEGWAIHQEYIDRETGGYAARAEFRRMFADAAKRRFDVVLFWALDRLSRQRMLDTLQHLNTLSARLRARKQNKKVVDSLDHACHDSGQGHPRKNPRPARGATRR